MDLHVCLSTQPEVHHRGYTISLADVCISLMFGSDLYLESRAVLITHPLAQTTAWHSS